MQNNPIKAYQAVEASTLSGRQLEASMLFKSAAQMLAVQKNWDSQERDAQLDESLRYNQRLWTVFQSEMLNPESPVPLEIRQNILSLSAFVDKRTFEVISYPDPAKLNILIEINRNIAAGLNSNAVAEVASTP